MTRILLIEDDAALRTALRLILVHAGHAVVEAGDGRDGLNHFTHEEFDLVITDLVMPEKEGLEVLADLSKNHPSVKIIAISGGGRAAAAADYLAMAEGLGANKVLAKPFSHDALLNAISELFARQ